MLAASRAARKNSSCNVYAAAKVAGDARARERFQRVVKFYTIKLTANSCIVLCGSTNAVRFSSVRTTKRFSSSRCASAIQIICPPGRGNLINNSLSLLVATAALLGVVALVLGARQETQHPVHASAQDVSLKTLHQRTVERHAGSVTPKVLRCIGGTRRQ